MDVVRLGKGVFDELEREGNAELERVRPGVFEQPVVKAAATAEATAPRVEGEAGTEEGVDFGGRNLGQGGRGLADAEGTRQQVARRVFHRVEREAFARDARVNPAPVGMRGDQRQQVGFDRQRGEGRDRADIRAGGQPAGNGVADGRGIVGVSVQAASHDGAERGLGGRERVGICHLPSVGVLSSLAPMKAGWQAMVGLMMATMTLSAQEPSPIGFVAPKIAPGLWKDLGMLETERDEYATNLANYAANRVATSKGTLNTLREAQRVLAVSLHLSPRNRKALVVLFQLNKGVLPEAVEGDYSPQVFARLLLARGQQLEKQAGENDVAVARVFIELAAQIDPKNEDAAYFSEIRRLDHGPVDWKALTDSP